MNWLAHALLSEPDTEARLGNLLADIVKGKDRAGLAPAFMRGVRLHQRIDAFTDTHTIVARSRTRIPAEHRRIAGILVDIFYDHFLSRHWSRFAPMTLGDFTAGLYRDLAAYRPRLPAHLHRVLDAMIGQDWLGSYGTLGGIELALTRLSRRLQARLGTTLGMETAAPALTAHFAGLGADFEAFFPLLRARFSAAPSPAAAALSSDVPRPLPI